MQRDRGSNNGREWTLQKTWVSPRELGKKDIRTPIAARHPIFLAISAVVILCREAAGLKQWGIDVVAGVY